MHHFIHSILPKKWLSLLIYKISRIKKNPFKNFIIYLFIKFTKTTLDDAVRKSINEYESLLDLFTRELDIKSRPIKAQPKDVISPADGTIAHIGKIENKQIFQIKKYTYSLDDLVSESYSNKYAHGEASTIYLAPCNYHRIHMPISGTLLRARYIPGELNSVSIKLLDKIPGLFAKNERVVLEFKDEKSGCNFLLVLVGAVNVGSIETITHGEITPNQFLSPIDLDCNNNYFEQGSEIGRFNLGSTVILITEKSYLTWHKSLKENSKLQMGNIIGSIK